MDACFLTKADTGNASLFTDCIAWSGISKGLTAFDRIASVARSDGPRHAELFCGSAKNYLARLASSPERFFVLLLDEG
jgi:hypothetical protein